MKYALLILLLVGCVSKPSPVPQPPIPKVVPNAHPLALTAPVPQQKRYYFMPLSYPTNASQFLWQLQQSSNKTNWVTIAPGPGAWTWSNQWWWVGAPTTNWNFTVTNAGKTVFWRMRGVKP